MVGVCVSTVLFVIAAGEPLSPTLLFDRMIGSRRAFATASLTWRETYPDRMPEYRSNRYDGVNWTFSRLPDPDGVVQYAQLGQPFSCWESSYLIEDGRAWFALDGSRVVVRDDKTAPHKPGSLFGFPGIIDARIVGLHPENVVGNLDELPSRFVNPAKGVVQDKGGGIVDLTLGTITWTIDTKKNYNPIRVVRRINGEIASEAQVDLAFYDDHIWFPQIVRMTRYDEKRRPIRFSTEFTSAEFDRPTHPARLTPTHIGVPRYSPVGVMHGPTEYQTGWWDGDQIISEDEFVNRRKSNAIDLSEYQAKLFGQDSEAGSWPKWYSDPAYGISKPSDIDEWDKYVRRFCLIHKCDDRQKASAKGILDDCRKTAVPLLARIKTEQAKEKDVAKREAMLTPIADIFNKNLVPRLEALLSTPQSQPTSKPAA